MSSEWKGPPIEEMLINTSRDWLSSVARGEQEFTPVDLYGAVGAVYILKVRKHPHNTPFPDEFTVPGSKGPISISSDRDMKANTEFRTVRYTDDEGNEHEIVVGGDRDSTNHEFAVINPETGDMVGDPSTTVPHEIGLQIAEELLVGLNYFDKPSPHSS